MLRLAADEKFNADIVRGLLRRIPALDVVRVQDVGLSGADDPAVLEWAAPERRLLLTHDASTLVGVALARVAAQQPDARRLRRPIQRPCGLGDRGPRSSV
jgi:predicted nuclease of predicted toxin-antitoxin system